jgi:hypothetical protein
MVLCDSGIDNIQQFKSSLFLRPEKQYLDSISKYCNRFKINRLAVEEWITSYLLGHELEAGFYIPDTYLVYAVAMDEIADYCVTESFDGETVNESKERIHNMISRQVSNTMVC